MTDLIERVARAIGDVPKKAVDDAIEGVKSYEEAMAYLKTMHRRQAKAAISIILEEAAKVAEKGCLVPPDGGSPTEDERIMCDGIAAAIRGLGGDDG